MAPSGGLFSILKQYNQTHDKKIDIDTIQSPSNGDNLKMVGNGRRDAMFLNWNTYKAVQDKVHEDVKIGGIVKKNRFILFTIKITNNYMMISIKRHVN